MAELFTQPERIFYNTSQKNLVQRQKNQVKPDFLTPLKLGTPPEYTPKDMFYELYGRPLNIQKPLPYLHTFEKKNTFPIPYLLNETNNKLVDVLGVYYRNKDLPVIPARM
jgi:hypothetical protein